MTYSDFRESINAHLNRWRETVRRSSQLPESISFSSALPFAVN